MASAFKSDGNGGTVVNIGLPNLKPKTAKLTLTLGIIVTLIIAISGWVYKAGGLVYAQSQHKEAIEANSAAIVSLTSRLRGTEALMGQLNEKMSITANDVDWIRKTIDRKYNE